MLATKRVLGLLAALAATIGAARAQDPALIEAGKEIYAAQCAPCHGENLRNPGTSFDLKELHENERARFDKSVMEGKGQMPPWRGTLGEAELDRLWAYVRRFAYD